jgi:hypothetical protein
MKLNVFCCYRSLHSASPHTPRTNTSHRDFGMKRSTAPLQDKFTNVVEDKLPNKVSYLSHNALPADTSQSATHFRQSSRNSVASNGTDDSESRHVQRSAPANSAKISPGSTSGHCHRADDTTESGHPVVQRCSSQEDQHSALLNFVSEKITYGRWLRCVVSHVDDPENFYCQLEGDNNVRLLESLMARVEKYVHSLPPGIGLLRTAALGQPVIAKYSMDGSWYRARVTGTDKVTP